MMLHRILGRALCSAAALMASFALLADLAAGAEAYPSRPGRLIVPFGAGASTDIIARVFAARFSELWGQPLVIESGLPGFEVTVWQGFAVPVGTPQAAVQKIHTAMIKALAAPDLRQRLFDQGVTATSATPEEFLAYVKSERARWAKVVKDSGTTVE